MIRQPIIKYRGKVAALFVEEGGCYYNLPLVDPWPICKDARKYNGPYPIIAHPPCQRWGNLAYVNYKRWGGEHNKPGNDNGCFFSALTSLIRFGGVLEHPAKSHAWKYFNLLKPKKRQWTRCRVSNIWTCEVWQSVYGHKANKVTWLAYYGKIPPYDLNWEQERGSFQIGFLDHRGKLRNKPTLNKKESNATPVKFRDELIKLAIWSFGINYSKRIRIV